MNNKAAIYVIEMCTKMVDHYTKVINSCDTITQLEIANRWSSEGLKGLRELAEKLPRRRRKICLAALEIANSFICNVSLTKSMDITFQRFEKIMQRPFERASEKTLEDLLETLRKSGARGVIVKVERKTSDADPANEQPTEKEDPEKPNEETGEDPPKE